MREYDVRVDYATGGMESIRVNAKDDLSAFSQVIKAIRAKEKIRGYRPILRLEVAAVKPIS